MLRDLGIGPGPSSDPEPISSRLGSYDKESARILGQAIGLGPDLGPRTGT